MNDSNPLVMDRNTKMSQPFQLNNYNGSVAVTDLPKGYEIVDENGNPVSQVESGKNYRVKYTGQSVPSNTTANDVANKIQAKASYESLKDSNFFSAQMTNASPNAVNPWQNMVNLSTIENSFNFPIVWQNVSSSSSSSSSVGSSSQASSSSVKSSVGSSSQASSSSVKSGSAVSSSQKDTSSTKQAVVVGVHNNTNSGKGTGHGQGQGEGHGMPQTGEAVATSLIAAGVVLLAAAGVITFRKRN